MVKAARLCCFPVSTPCRRGQGEGLVDVAGRQSPGAKARTPALGGREGRKSHGSARWEVLPAEMLVPKDLEVLLECVYDMI